MMMCVHDIKSIYDYPSVSVMNNGYGMDGQVEWIEVWVKLSENDLLFMRISKT